MGTMLRIWATLPRIRAPPVHRLQRPFEPGAVRFGSSGRGPGRGYRPKSVKGRHAPDRLIVLGRPAPTEFEKLCEIHFPTFSRFKMVVAPLCEQAGVRIEIVDR